MTIDEAIKNREDCLKYLEEIGPKASHDCLEAVRWSVKALRGLRPVSREQVEKMRRQWRLVPNGVGGKQYMCSRCGGAEYEYWRRHFAHGNEKFCSRCRAPMTDEAVQMVMERMKELK